MRAPSTSSRARCLAESPGAPSARSSAAKDSSAEPDRIRHCVSVQCRSTIRSGSAAWPSARSATRSAAARSPVRYSASASRTASHPCVADPAGMAPTARASSSAATPGAWPTRESADVVEPVHHPVRSVVGRAAQQLPGDALGRRARRGEGVPGVPMPGGADGGRHLRVQRLPDQRVAERQAVDGIGQHAGRAGLVERRHQVGHGPAEHGGQIGDRELHAEQRGGAEHLPGRCGDESEPVSDNPRQRVRHGCRWRAGRCRTGRQ